MEELTPDRLNRKQGILFMPNHPAHVDPLINFVWLWPKFQMRPLEIDHIYNLPLLKLINKRLKAISIPNFELAVNEYKVKQAEKSIGEIAAGLKRGENFIVYPAGRLKTTKKELLGGSSGAHELLRECPEANVVLIRTTGLWGSSFSRALIGRSPKLGPTIAHALKVILKNLIFFTPRRKVLIEIEPNPAGMPRENGSRIELNRYLEGWYNRYPDDQGNISERSVRLSPTAGGARSCLRFTGLIKNGVLTEWLFPKRPVARSPIRFGRSSTNQISRFSLR